MTVCGWPFSTHVKYGAEYVMCYNDGQHFGIGLGSFVAIFPSIFGTAYFFDYLLMPFERCFKRDPKTYSMEMV